MQANAPDPASPPPAEVTIRALFDDGSGRVFDERSALLASGEPADWEGIAFPLELAFELASACNLRCVMCPVPTTSRAAALMNEDLFRRAAREAAGEKGFVLLPQGFGESMLHPRWAQLLEYARLQGIRPIILLTNGMLLNERNLDKLLALHIDAVVVSIDGVNPDTYASVRVGGNLETVEENVRSFLARRKDPERPKLVLRIIRMKETEQEIAAFFALWRPLLSPGDEIRINEFNDWAGKVEDRSTAGFLGSVPGARPACRMLWSNLSVHADGKVSACCHDSEDELIVGDLNASDTLRSIWRGEPLRRLRQIHREGRIEELPICQACKNWR